MKLLQPHFNCGRSKAQHARANKVMKKYESAHLKG